MWLSQCTEAKSLKSDLWAHTPPRLWGLGRFVFLSSLTCLKWKRVVTTGLVPKDNGDNQMAEVGTSLTTLPGT